MGGFIAQEAFGDDGLFSQIDLGALEIEVVDFEVLSPPGSPSTGDSFVVGRNATGPWYTWDDQVATYAGNGVWQRVPVTPGSRARKAGSSQWRTYGGNGWHESNSLGIAATGLTASATQGQGNGRLGHAFNRVETVGTTGDSVTLPPARRGASCIVVNDGANSLAAYPDSGEKIDALSVDAAKTVAAGKRALFFCASNGAWSSLVGA